MGEADAGAAAGRVLAALREARRSGVTIGRCQVVLGRFAAFLAGRGLDSASDQVRVDFIAGQTGTRLGSLHERVQDKRVQAVRRAALSARPWPPAFGLLPGRLARDANDRK